MDPLQVPNDTLDVDKTVSMMVKLITRRALSEEKQWTTRLATSTKARSKFTPGLFSLIYYLKQMYYPAPIALVQRHHHFHLLNT